jgi:hypothetical protein
LYLALVEIVRADRHKSALPADVVVQLLLHRDEAVVALLIERNVTKHSRHHIRADLFGLAETTSASIRCTTPYRGMHY